MQTGPSGPTRRAPRPQRGRDRTGLSRRGWGGAPAETRAWSQRAVPRGQGQTTLWQEVALSTPGATGSLQPPSVERWGQSGGRSWDGVNPAISLQTGASPQPRDGLHTEARQCQNGPWRHAELCRHRGSISRHGEAVCVRPTEAPPGPAPRTPERRQRLPARRETLMIIPASYGFKQA